MPNEKARQSALTEIAGAVERAAQQGSGLDEERLYAEYAMKRGTSRRTFNDYLRVLTIADRIRVSYVDGRRVLSKPPVPPAPG